MLRITDYQVWKIVKGIISAFALEIFLLIGLAGFWLGSTDLSEYYWFTKSGLLLLVGAIGTSVKQWRRGDANMFMPLVAITLWSLASAIAYRGYAFALGSEILTEVFNVSISNHGKIRYITSEQSKNINIMWGVVLLSMIGYYSGTFGLKIAQKVNLKLPRWIDG